MADFLSRLGIYTEPNEQEPPKALEEQVHQVTREASQTKMHFTPRDFDTLGIILEHPSAKAPAAKEIQYCEISNARLAKLLGMTAGAAAARVARLVKMGVVKPWYEVAVETGKVNRRILQIMQIPPAPWSPDGS
jgi:DNA-binding MarR family transcriptional regulator